MDTILVEKSPSHRKLDVLGTDGWPLKKLVPGKYTHTYKASEECYISAGEAILSCELQPTPVSVSEGDLLFIPQGLTVTWQVIIAIEYHWRSENKPLK